MSSGGFWPGDPPAAEEDDGHEPEPLVAGPPGWPQPQTPAEPPQPSVPPTPRPPEEEPEPEPLQPEPAPEPEPEPERVPEPAAVEEAVQEPAAVVTEPEPEVQEPEPPAAHVPGELEIPDGVAVLEGAASGADRTVGVVVSRFNGEISNRLLESALDALRAAGVAEERITVMPVPGAFELPIGAMALAKTRRYSCVVALGCVVRGETPHFDYVAGEAASGLQLAGLETGVPVAFGVLTVDSRGQAERRIEKGADAARAALEMADLFAQVRSSSRS